MSVQLCLHLDGRSEVGILSLQPRLTIPCHLLPKSYESLLLSGMPVERRSLVTAGGTALAILSETKTWLSILDKFLDGAPIPSGIAGAAVELIRVVEVSSLQVSSSSSPKSKSK